MATIKNVAQRAGVSPSTVSYVLSGLRPIGEETRQRVMEAVEELGYEPNASARALRSTRTRVLALLGVVTAGHVEAGVTGLFMLAIADAVRERGYDLLIIPAHEGITGLERLARASMADAAIVMGILMEDPRVTALQQLAFPAALMGHPAQDVDLNWVDLDFTRAGELALELLAAEGHRHVAFLGQPQEIYDGGAAYAVRALAGAQQAATTAQVTLVGPLYIERIDRVADVLSHAFDSEPETSAIILQYEQALPDVLRWLRSSGRRVPEDVHLVIVGAWTRDNTESQVTYVSSTVQRMASAAVELAIEASLHQRTRSVVLPPVVSVSAH